MTILTKNTDKLREEVAAIADTFRALCAELTAWAEKTSAHYFQPPDEPAVPESREPAAVTGQPSDEELALIYHDCCRGCEFMDQGGFEDAARAVLARWGNPAPAPPADGEVAGLVADLQQQANHGFSEFISRNDLLRAAELLQRQALVPVSVSERPWEREGWCDAEGKCWIRGKVEGDWRLINPTNSGVPNLKYCFTHCLPAHALPLPEVGE